MAGTNNGKKELASYQLSYHTTLMKLKLTDEQRAKMKLVFSTLDELRKDKKFMKLLNDVTDNDFDEKNITNENEDDYMNLVNFYDNLHDYSNFFCTFD